MDDTEVKEAVCSILSAGLTCVVTSRYKYRHHNPSYSLCHSRRCCKSGWDFKLFQHSILKRSVFKQLLLLLALFVVEHFRLQRLSRSVGGTTNVHGIGVGGSRIITEVHIKRVLLAIVSRTVASDLVLPGKIPVDVNVHVNGPTLLLVIFVISSISKVSESGFQTD